LLLQPEFTYLEVLSTESSVLVVKEGSCVAAAFAIALDCRRWSLEERCQDDVHAYSVARWVKLGIQKIVPLRKRVERDSFGSRRMGERAKGEGVDISRGRRKPDLKV
jgi:hypothetical protein